MDNEKKVRTCVCGFQLPEGAIFCPECGTVPSDNSDNAYAANASGIPTNGYYPVAPSGVAGVCGVAAAVCRPEDTEETADNPPDDSNLKLLIDCCGKTLATGCGDSCDEIVLYLDEKTGEYQIHTYYRGFGSFKETHRGYKTDKEAYDRAMEAIVQARLPEYDGNIGAPMCGGEYVCKFLYEGKVIRLTSSNAPQGDLYSVGSVLKSFIDKENEIFGNKN